ncbi:MAG: prolipoprotein diacylglyceryl transferase, partial [Candidatus Hydrogenedentes bacterium]|nr:prolipoprotein diacylglyceryl transferase [Candidatus Hydrogenedentota bacterium]
MRPTLFELGIFEFHSYTVFMALGFLVGTILPVQENYRLPKPYPVTPAGGLWVFVFALLGAKIYWFIQYGD